MLGGLKTTAITAGIALAVGFAGGWQVQGWRWDAALADAQEQAIAEFKAQRKADMAVAERHEERQEAREERVRVVEKEVERVVTEVVTRNDCRLPPDTLRVWNDAVRAATQDATSGSDAPVLDPAHP